jgi:hypothetical protein
VQGSAGTEAPERTLIKTTLVKSLCFVDGCAVVVLPSLVYEASESTMASVSTWSAVSPVAIARVKTRVVLLAVEVPAMGVKS